VVGPAGEPAVTQADEPAGADPAGAEPEVAEPVVVEP
jgi:hypothetical protein